MKNILITGGAGFIGSHLVRYLLNKYPNYEIINLDLLTYAGNITNLNECSNNPNYKFIYGDIGDRELIKKTLSDYNIDTIIHLAAESHVDRSIENPSKFIETNVLGTVNLLQSAVDTWKNKLSENLFYHVSTDEVFGSLGLKGSFKETTRYDPRSPYSASKASSDHFVRAYGETFGLRYLISNCSNNYGENQFPEKLIPVVINSVINQTSIPVYGDGKNVRDWLYVGDHCEAIDTIIHSDISNNTFCIGGDSELTNLELIKKIIKIADVMLGNQENTSTRLIDFVRDRAGHDRRYAIDASKLKSLNWKPRTQLDHGLSKTIKWYIDNKVWLSSILDKSYLTANLKGSKN